MPAELESFLPILIFLVVVLGFAASALIASHLIGPWRKVNPTRELPYESGMDPVGSARQHFDIKFYLVAVLFLVFDVELLFLYPWAVSAYQQSPGHWDPEHRRQVFWLITIFLATLAVSFIYAWRKGVFRWR